MKVLLILALLTGAAWAGPVMLKVDVVGDKEQETKGPQGKTKGKTSGMPEHVVKDTRQLEITLNNTSNREFTGVNVVYYIFAKDVKEKDVVLAKKKEKTVKLPSMGKQMIATENA